MPDERSGRRNLVPAAAIVATLIALMPPAAAQRSPARAQICAKCHGIDGNSSTPGSPSLAGQPRLFLESQLVMIREGLRDIPAMKGVLDGMPDDELVALARHFSAQALEPPDVTLDSERAQRGAVLAVRALCGTCHLADYRGRDQIPRLAGQREDYLLAAMRQFRTGVAPGRDTIMSAALHGLSDADLSDLAHYFATYRARAER